MGWDALSLKLPLEEIIPLLKYLAEGFKLLGSKNCFHGDLNLENIGYKTNNGKVERLFFADFDGMVQLENLVISDIKLIFATPCITPQQICYKDFLLANTFIEKFRSTTALGTKGNFLKLELDRYKAFLLKCDVFSFGLILWDLLSPTTPLFSYKEASKQKYCDTTKRLEKSTFIETLTLKGFPEEIAEDFYTLVTEMTVDDHLKRSSHDDVYQKLLTIISKYESLLISK